MPFANNSESARGTMKANRISFTIINSPLGELVLGVTNRGCCLVEFVGRGGLEAIKTQTRRRYKLELVEGENRLLNAVEQELSRYFSGTSRSFSVPLDLQGTRFEQNVWRKELPLDLEKKASLGNVCSV